jgi:GT2 family glycosyltransferase
MRQASVIIPVWNGADVIADCLDAVYAHAGDRLGEVICVDNASPDSAAAIITGRFPQARLIAQAVNLGFAGGVNAGLRAAHGDVSVLLNQDCLAQAGWLDALLAALEAHPEFGIAGCTIFNADGSINHAGAQLRKPGALGQHLTERGDGQPRAVDYVTGAAMAIRRSTWDTVGPFDEGFYPAYYEEVDYCYRARQHGLAIGYVPTATVRHLFSSREWQHDPIKHWAAHQHCRYRFVGKHFAAAELTAFFEFEAAEIEAEPSFEMNTARVLGSRDTLRRLAEIVARRAADLADPLTAEQVRLLHAGFTRITRGRALICRRAGWTRRRGRRPRLTSKPCRNSCAPSSSASRPF